MALYGALPEGDSVVQEQGSRDGGRAMEYALRLLEFRARTRKELEERLERKGFAREEVLDVLSRLELLGYVNDDRFAREWARARVDTRGFGRLRIRRELLSKGIARDVVDAGLEGVFSGVSEEELARGLVEKQVSRYRNLDLTTIRRRLWGFLSRRGFKPDVIESVLRKLDPS
ncbi:MAG: regulatory protein RecX [Firmicutes bacterium]|nr:regulatory protein RecX [Bacillota bacterium]